LAKIEKAKIVIVIYTSMDVENDLVDPPEPVTALVQEIAQTYKTYFVKVENFAQLSSELETEFGKIM